MRDRAVSLQSERSLPERAQDVPTGDLAVQRIPRIEAIVEAAVQVSDHAAELVLTTAQLAVRNADSAIEVAKTHAVEDSRM